MSREVRSRRSFHNRFRNINWTYNSVEIAIVILVFAVILTAIIVPCKRLLKLDEDYLLLERSFYSLRTVDFYGDDVPFDEFRRHNLLVVFATSTNMLIDNKNVCNDKLPKKGKDPGDKWAEKLLLFFPCSSQFHDDSPGLLDRTKLAFALRSCDFRIRVFNPVEVRGEDTDEVWKWLDGNRYDEIKDALDRVEFTLDMAGRITGRRNVRVLP
ncbi:uncharacterized protein [Venturia canescens]|uniref:uncharacterized protein isoform X2 n=1 Tax=Venturia canescens TaxID=32260 RepID=UPI001C9C355E|nr:uncharacterized protein LOC122417218 isoform X2 [Venturia canescens]